MTDLTEQWKKGELPSGYYYVKNEFGNIFPSDYSEDYDCISDRVIKDFFTEVSEIKEVLEPVPSYKKWKAKLEKLKDLLEKDRATINDLKQVREALTSNGSTYGFLDTIIRDFERDIQNYEAEVLND